MIGQGTFVLRSARRAGWKSTHCEWRLAVEERLFAPFIFEMR